MNEFQSKAISEIGNLIKRYPRIKPDLKYAEVKSSGKSSILEKILALILGGRKLSAPGEIAYETAITTAALTVNIFVYTDELGMMVNKSWEIWEAADFDSPDELISRFIGKLKHALDKDS